MASWGGFGDAWRQKSGFYVDPNSVVHQADPAHNGPQGDPNPVWGAPSDLDAAASPDFLYADDVLSGGDWVTDDIGGDYRDMTPTDHNVGGELGVTLAGPDTVAANADSANQSYGAEREAVYRADPIMDFTTVQTIPRFQGNGPGASVMNPLVYVRGLNADTENNPGQESYGGEGFRRGWVEQTFVDRKLQVTPWNGRTHDRRLLLPNTSFSNDQAQEAVDGTYGSPFNSLAKSLSSISQTPMIRRQAETISESVTTDGSDQSYSELPGDWIGQ
jgi:hypothetical protein